MIVQGKLYIYAYTIIQLACSFMFYIIAAQSYVGVSCAVTKCFLARVTERAISLGSSRILLLS